MGTCKRCGEPEYKEGFGFCRRHRNYYYKDKRPLHDCTCEKCGKVFSHVNSLARFCSFGCRNSANSALADKKAFDYGTRKCEVCGKEFTARSSQSKYCGRPCLGRANYIRNIDTFRERDRIRTRKTSIGYRIRDEHLQKNNRIAKWVWDGIGPWSWKHPDIDRCVECNSTVYKHCGNGVCAKCFDQMRYRDQEKLDEFKRAWYVANKENRGSQKKIAQEWIDKARNVEIPITPKIDNLLLNLEEIEKQEEERKSKKEESGSHHS